MSNIKVNKDKAQKESHCEIERKRRERMKLETEYLHRQVPDSQCKDKLSIFLAGAERLIYYTEKLGKRDYIINDDEYSRIIMNSFCGFAIQIRCSDGIILYEVNAEKILGVCEGGFVGKSIYKLVQLNSDTTQIIGNSLSLYDLESQQAEVGELISRNFVLSLRCGPEISSKYCIRGSDGELYRFIEFCGDLLFTDSILIFRGLCRPLDTACTTISSVGKSDLCCDLSQEHVTFRLSSEHFLITEVVGNSMDLLGWSVQYLLGKHLNDFSLGSEPNVIEQGIQEGRCIILSNMLEPNYLEKQGYLSINCREFNLTSKSPATITLSSCFLPDDETVHKNFSDSKGILNHQNTDSKVTNIFDMKQVNSNSTFAQPGQTIVEKSSPRMFDHAFNLTNSNDLNAEDWRQLPINPSLDQVLSETDHPDLFHPDYLKDLIQEDVTDL